MRGGLECSASAVVFLLAVLLVVSQSTALEERVVVSANSTILLSCYPDSDRRFLLIDAAGTAVDRQRFCYFGVDGTLELFLRVADPSDATVYTCEHANVTTAFRISISDVSTVPERLTPSSPFSVLSVEDARDLCGEGAQRNRSSTAVWKRNGQTICTEGVQCTGVNATLQADSEEEEESSCCPYLAPICTVSMGLLVLNLVLFGCIYMRRRGKELKRLSELYTQLTGPKAACALHECVNFVRPLHEQVDQLPYDINYEIRLYRLSIKKVISKGEYGRVYSGQLRGKGMNRETMAVHVKGPKRKANFDDVKALTDELKILMAVGAHPNVLCLIGTVAEDMQRGGDVYGILEPTVFDLKTFLTKSKGFFINELSDKETPDAVSSPTRKMSQSRREKLKKTLGPSISTSVLNSFSYQIANGMEYLASKMCVHRDLAARNVFLRKNRVVRLSGFGNDRQWDYEYLFQSIQYASPFKAMARESIGGGSPFNEKSDVWSYGVLLWEIFTLGEDPFKDFETPQKLAAFYESGGRLSRPPYMPDTIAHVMYDCWKEDPNARPSFKRCKTLTEKHLRDTNPQLLDWLLDQLKEEMSIMKNYSELRDGPSHNFLRPSRSVNSDSP